MRRRYAPGIGRRGSAGLEFALIVPVMTTLFFGMFEVALSYRVNLKLAYSAEVLADIIGQQTSPVTPGIAGLLGNFCKGAQLAMTPYSGTLLAAAIASVTNNAATGTVAMDWENDVSCPLPATPIGATAAIALATTPNNMVPNPGDSVVIVQTSYTYVSTIHYLLGNTHPLTQTAFQRPRASSGTIACTGC
jgi:Flp pilus assembly protein TadG